MLGGSGPAVRECLADVAPNVVHSRSASVCPRRPKTLAKHGLHRGASGRTHLRHASEAMRSVWVPKHAQRGPQERLLQPQRQPRRGDGRHGAAAAAGHRRDLRGGRELRAPRVRRCPELEVLQRLLRAARGQARRRHLHACDAAKQQVRTPTAPTTAPVPLPPAGWVLPNALFYISCFYTDAWINRASVALAPRSVVNSCSAGESSRGSNF